MNEKMIDFLHTFDQQHYGTATTSTSSSCKEIKHRKRLFECFKKHVLVKMEYDQLTYEDGGMYSVVFDGDDNKIIVTTIGTGHKKTHFLSKFISYINSLYTTDWRCVSSFGSYFGSRWKTIIGAGPEVNFALLFLLAQKSQMTQLCNTLQNKKHVDVDACEPNASISTNMLKCWLNCERTNMIMSDYISRSLCVNALTRKIIIYWMIEVHQRFDTSSASLYLSIQILDCFLSIKVCSKFDLQLVGCASMLLASKYNEIRAQEEKDFVFITNKNYNATHLNDMQTIIFQTLPHTFVQIPFLHIFVSWLLHTLDSDNKHNDKHNKRMKALVLYISESFTTHASCLKYLWSNIALCAFHIASNYFKTHVFENNFDAYSSIKHLIPFIDNETEKCGLEMLQNVQQIDTKYPIVQEKYKLPVNYNVSNILPTLFTL